MGSYEAKLQVAAELQWLPAARLEVAAYHLGRGH